MTVCKELFEKMSEYLDGEMNLAMMKEAEKHLGQCTGCKETVEAFQKDAYLSCKEPGQKPFLTKKKNT